MLKRFLSLRLITIVNLIAMMAVVTLETIMPEHNGIGAILITVPQALLLLPSLLILLSAVVWRRWWIVVLNLFVLSIGGLLLLAPSYGSPDNVTPTDVKVMTYNIMMGKLDLNGIYKTIAQEHPDVVCLQEANLHRSDHFLPYHMKLRMPEYQIVYMGDMLIAARHKISEGRIIPLAGQGSVRQGMMVDININGHSLTVVNVHFIHARYDRMSQHPLLTPQIARETCSLRVKQAETILQTISDSHSPLVLCGDMNSQPKGTFYRLLQDRLTDTWNATNCGLGYSFNSTCPYARIDYIWSNGALRPLRSRTLSRPYSDHFPLITEFSWNTVNDML
jgi:endonuclease/exonuclease/phosphatase family metal-dependent hydrolase